MSLRESNERIRDFLILNCFSGENEKNTVDSYAHAYFLEARFALCVSPQERLSKEKRVKYVKYRPSRRSQGKLFYNFNAYSTSEARARPKF